VDVFEIIRIALRALQANKLRSAFTMHGMIIGVAAVIAMAEIGNVPSQVMEDTQDIICKLVNEQFYSRKFVLFWHNSFSLHCV